MIHIATFLATAGSVIALLIRLVKRFFSLRRRMREDG